MKIISRSQWGARHPNGFGSRAMPVREFWLHHSVTIAPDLKPPFTDDDNAVRTLEDIGQSRFKGGISYTFPVTPVGRIYEGHSIDRRGAHTAGHNTVGAAFCLVGNYDSLAPTRAQMVAIAQTMCDLHRAGKATRHTLNGGHRDTFPTACPGAKAYATIGQINRIANEIWAGKKHTVDTSAGDVWEPTGKWSVKQIQTELGVKADGVYGSATTAAVREIQQALDLTADGLWGPTTEGAVMSLIKKIDNLDSDLLSAREDLKVLKTASKGASRIDLKDRVELSDADRKRLGGSKLPSISVGALLKYGAFAHFSALDDDDKAELLAALEREES